MTPIQCAIDIVEFLKPKFADFTFSDPKMQGRKINIRSGFMRIPLSNDEKEAQGGYINVQPIEIDDEDDDELSSSVLMRILVATYHEDAEKGHIEFYNILETVRQNLLKTPVINGIYEVAKPIKTHILDDQPFPQWLGYIETTVKIPEINREVNLNA